MMKDCKIVRKTVEKIIRFPIFYDFRRDFIKTRLKIHLHLEKVKDRLYTLITTALLCEQIFLILLGCFLLRSMPIEFPVIHKVDIIGI